MGQYGFELNLARCESYIIGGTGAERRTAEGTLRAIFTEINIVADTDLCLLGLPITQAAVYEKLVTKSADVTVCFLT